MRTLPLLRFSLSIFARSDPVSRSWNEPVEPFRIGGNLYYAGTTDIAAYLFATPAGHILLDGGFAETAPQIQRNVEKLGFRVSDIRILLSSHAPRIPPSQHRTS